MERSNLSSKKEFLLKSAKAFRPIDIVVILATVAALYMFRLPDGYQLNPIWQLKRTPANQQLIHAQPLITDIDGNGLKELIIASGDKIEIFSYHESEFDEMSSEHASIKDDTMQEVLYHLHSKKEVKFTEIIGTDEATIHPVVINAGCVTTIHHELCVQSLAIVWSDWTITLLSDQLKVLWKSRPMKIAFRNKLQITEMSVLVVHQNNSLLGENGLVIVGGVLNLKDHKLADLPKHHHSIRSAPSETPDVISEERAGVEPDSSKHGLSHDLDLESAKYLGHFTTYALDGKTGEMKWKHEPGDFEEVQQVPDEEQQPQLHFKLRLRKKRLHTGEVHWSKFTTSFLKHLPYAWKHYTDTDITLGNFKRSSATKPSEPNVYIIPEQLQALFKTTKIPKASHGKDENNSNVVVLRHKHAIEVLNLENGSPVCALPLDGTTRSAMGDVIGDKVVERVKTYVYQGLPGSAPTCFIVASDASVRSSIHFNSSVCHPLSIYSYFDEEDELPRVHTELGMLAPLLLKPVERSSSLFEHFLGYGLARVRAGLDSFVLLSSGKLVAFAPSGRFLWQIDTGVTWPESRFYPSMKPLNFEATEPAVIILGPSDITVVSLVDGSILSTHSFPCLSTQPLISGDINNDGTEEFLVRCEGRYLGFSLERYNRLGWTLLLYSGIAFLVSFLLCVIKVIEKEDFPVEVIESVTEHLRLFPVQVPKR